MSNLIERYIAVATRNLPERARAETAREIRVMIDEMVEARVSAGEERAVAAAAVLNELGEPERVARSFEERPRYLIGPRYFGHYTWLVRTLLSWVPAVAFFAQLLLNVLTDDRAMIESLVRGGLSAAGTAFIVAIQIVFWVTLVYAIMERAEPSGAGPEEKVDWTVADLPEEEPRRQVSAVDAAWCLGTMFVAGTLLVVQHVRGVEAFVRSKEVTAALDGRVIPFFNPDIPAWMAAAVFGLVAFTAITEIVKFGVGYWTGPVAAAEIVSSLVWILQPSIVIGQWGLINPDLDRIWDNDTTDWLTGNQFERIFLVVMIAMSVISIVEAVRGYRAYRRRAPEIIETNEDFVFIV